MQLDTDCRADYDLAADEEHGHPLSYDDSILESGNHLAKNGKGILFWGGGPQVGRHST